MHPLKHARIMGNITQDQLAEMTGIKQSMISKYENYTPVQDRDIAKLAEVLNLSEDELRHRLPKSSILKDLRVSRKMPKHILAKHCCVTTTMVTQWENGKPPSSYHRDTLALIFGIDPSLFRPGAVMPPGLQPEFSTERDSVRGELLQELGNLNLAQLRHLLVTAKEMQNVVA